MIPVANLCHTDEFSEGVHPQGNERIEYLNVPVVLQFPWFWLVLDA